MYVIKLIKSSVPIFPLRGSYLLHRKKVEIRRSKYYLWHFLWYSLVIKKFDWDDGIYNSVKYISFFLLIVKEISFNSCWKN